MQIVARAPGKLVVLGEYAVLDGAPALVIAVDRYCTANIQLSDDLDCHLEIRSPEPRLVVQSLISPASAPVSLGNRVVVASVNVPAPLFR